MNFLLVFVIPGLILLLTFLMNRSGDKKPVVSPTTVTKPKRDMKRMSLYSETVTEVHVKNSSGSKINIATTIKSRI